MTPHFLRDGVVPFMRIAIVGLLLVTRAAFAACPVERGPVKTATDPQALDIKGFTVTGVIETMQSIPAPRPLPQDARVTPEELQQYSVIATLTAYRVTADGAIQLVLSDEERRTILATIPPEPCVTTSRFVSDMTAARSAFRSRYPTASTALTSTRRAVEVRGVAFFDYQQGQPGLAPNGLSLYPVTYLGFRPPYTPTPPPLVGRRRSVGTGVVRNCQRPSFALTASRTAVCAGQSLTLAWSSDPSASVTIDQLGGLRPSSGTATVTPIGATVYSGHAENACGTSDEALTLVTLTPGATASLTGPSTIASGKTGTLSVSVSAIGSWSLSSALGNTISPSFGTSSGTATYTANRTGNDTVTLTTAGGACGNVQRTMSINVTSSSTPPPPLTIQCCDGTLSPSCTTCTQGCCSGHGGCKSCN